MHMSHKGRWKFPRGLACNETPWDGGIVLRLPGSGDIGTYRWPRCMGGGKEGRHLRVARCELRKRRHVSGRMHRYRHEFASLRLVRSNHCHLHCTRRLADNSWAFSRNCSLFLQVSGRDRKRRNRCRGTRYPIRVRHQALFPPCDRVRDPNGCCRGTWDGGEAEKRVFQTAT